MFLDTGGRPRGERLQGEAREGLLGARQNREREDWAGEYVIFFCRVLTSFKKTPLSPETLDDDSSVALLIVGLSHLNV